MKRAAEGLGDDGRRRGPKQGRAGKFGPHAFKVCCPEPLVARLVGNQGVLIHQIEDQSKSHLQFSPRGEYYPGTRLRILTVFTGEPHNIFEALTLVLDDLISKADEDRDGSRGRGGVDFVDDMGRPIFRCALSKAAAGAVIGTRGERVKSLRETTGAHIDVEREVVDSHQMVTIAGERDQVLSALEELNNTVQNDVDAPWFSEWANQRSIVPTRADGGGGGAIRKARGPPGGTREAGGRKDKESTIFVGRLSQATDAAGLRAHFSRWGSVVEADVKMDNQTGRSKGFGFVTFSSPQEVEDCLANMEEHAIDGRGVDVKRYGSDGDERPPPSERDDPNAQQEHADFEEPRAPPPPRQGWRDAGPAVPQRPPRQAAQGATGTVQWLAELAGSVPAEFLGYDYCISCSLPSAKCGALIGRRGEHVMEVQRQTGTQVEISKKDPREGPDAHRQISVQGPLLQVYAAHMLLMKHYNQEEKQFQDRGGAAVDEAQGKIQALEAQLAELTQNLANMKSGPGPGPPSGGKGGGKGSGKRGGKR